MNVYLQDTPLLSKMMAKAAGHHVSGKDHSRAAEPDPNPEKKESVSSRPSAKPAPVSPSNFPPLNLEMIWKDGVKIEKADEAHPQNPVNSGQTRSAGDSAIAAHPQNPVNSGQIRSAGDSAIAAHPQNPVNSGQIRSADQTTDEAHPKNPVNSGQIRSISDDDIDEEAIHRNPANSERIRTMEPREGEDLSLETVYRLRGAPESVRTRFMRLDEMLAFEIAQGYSLVQAARRANLSEKTARRRWRNPEFQERVRLLQQDLCAPAKGKLASNMSGAAQTLANCLNAESEYVRIAAVRVFLTIGQNLVNREADAKLTQRLDRLEAMMEDLLGNMKNSGW